MPSLRRTQRGRYIVCFRFAQRQYQRALKTVNEKAAQAVLGRVTHRLFQLATGDDAIPDGVDAGDYIVNGVPSPTPPPPAASVPTLNALV